MNTPLIPEDIHQHILDQAGSNLSIIQYCKIHALTYHRILYFKKKLNDYELKGASGFIPVEIDKAPGEYAAALEVQFPGGCQIRFFQPVAASFLRELLS